jgi:hypothetical protein
MAEKVNVIATARGEELVSFTVAAPNGIPLMDNVLEERNAFSKKVRARIEKELDSEQLDKWHKYGASITLSRA